MHASMKCVNAGLHSYKWWRSDQKRRQTESKRATEREKEKETAGRSDRENCATEGKDFNTRQEPKMSHTQSSIQSKFMGTRRNKQCAIMHMAVCIDSTEHSVLYCARVFRTSLLILPRISEWINMQTFFNKAAVYIHVYILVFMCMFQSFKLIIPFDRMLGVFYLIAVS